MNLNRQDSGTLRIVTVQEPRIDAAVAIAFKDQMRQMTDDADGNVLLDLAQVDFIDSSGLGAIVAAMKQLGAERRLHLSGMTPTVAKVFRLTRMDSVFTIHPDVDAALVGHAG